MDPSHRVNEMDRKYVENAPSTAFASLFEETSGKGGVQDVSVGQRVSGRIKEIGDAFAFVDFGWRSEAVVRLEELRDKEGDLRYGPGDPIEAYVVSTTDEILLSFRLRVSTIGQVRKAFQKGLPVEGRVTEFNTGGLVVNLAGRRAFCPHSQIETGSSEALESYVGKRLTFKILEFRGGGRNIVLSRRAHLDEEVARQAQELRSKLEKGKEMTGKVTRLERFGAFVDLGGVEGLVHISELSHANVRSPREVVSEDSEVQVKILDLKDLGKKGERISLSIKALMPDPWEEVLERLSEGDVITGRIVSVKKFGAFVEISPGVEGLVHVSQLPGNTPAKEKLSAGQEVEARITKIDRGQKRISLSMKAAQEVREKKMSAGEVRRFHKQGQKADRRDGGPMADALRRAGLA